MIKLTTICNKILEIIFFGNAKKKQKNKKNANNRNSSLTLFRLGFLRVAQLGGGGGGQGPAAYNFKTINDNEMGLGGVVKDR